MKIGSGGAEVRQRVRSQQKEGLMLRAQVLQTERKEKCEKNKQKAAHWVLNPRPLGYQRAALPLGWLYIR